MEEGNDDDAQKTEDQGAAPPAAAPTTTVMMAPTTVMGTVSIAPTTSTMTTIHPSLVNEEYFHGLLPRKDVQFLLRESGDFLLRISQPTTKDERQIIISLLANKSDPRNGLRHVILHKQMGKYYVEDSPRFEMVQDLIDHFIRSGQPVLPSVADSVLLNPIGRQKWELLHSNIELIKKIGAGVFGEVHKGKLKQKTGSIIEVAVKTAQVAALTKDGINDIMREARMMRTFKHPNVVRYYGVALDDDPIMIVMELVRGGALSDYLRNAAKISDAEKLNHMASGASWGLEYLHSHNCIHRDIAARNCLYDKSKVLKISDFGLSREGAEFKMTTTQRVPIPWIAPECLTNFTFTRASDVFSFGVLVWEIWTDGAKPFDGKKSSEIKAMLLDGARLEFPSTTPPDIKELVTKRIWNAKPEERYSMPEIVLKLEQLSGVKQSSTKPKHSSKAIRTKGENNVTMEGNKTWSMKKSRGEKKSSKSRTSQSSNRFE